MFSTEKVPGTKMRLPLWTEQVLDEFLFLFLIALQGV